MILFKATVLATGIISLALPTYGQAPKVNDLADAFELSDVSLTDSRWMDNQGRTVNYLLSIDPDRLLYTPRAPPRTAAGMHQTFLSEATSRATSSQHGQIATLPWEIRNVVHELATLSRSLQSARPTMQRLASHQAISPDSLSQRLPRSKTGL
ncbi:unnamed protein product [Fusarium graminearum]|nr:unnamed protein product [Fusarium graminearum]